ncbi:MAG: hypothetical protein KDA75_05765 [Planctomycetaceae bacterium]|nr:hypothetical protein [Planctomycetaceae bacterium]
MPENREILNVVTAVSRPANLATIQQHLIERLPSFDVRWHCVADINKCRLRPGGLECHFWGESPVADRAGGAQKNLALGEIASGWVYFLDDDNTIHPRFDAALQEEIKLHPDAMGFVFGQASASGQTLRVAAARNVKMGAIDIGQLILRRIAIDAHRFLLDVRASDWHLFEKVWGMHRERIHFSSVATFYNRLR